MTHVVRIGLAVVLALVPGCAGERGARGRAAGSGYTVGEMRTVHREGDARARIGLEEVRGLTNAFALGPVAGLRGEITLVDGRVSVARVDEGGAVRVEERWDAAAPFLVYGSVAAWRPVAPPERVSTLAELEAWLPGAASGAGLDPGAPFPFKITTARSRVEYHVMNNTGAGDRVATPPDGYKRTFLAAEGPLVLIGVYSGSHAGVFTHHGERTHIHVAGAGASGHVDGLTLGPDAQVFLPER